MLNVLLIGLGAIGGEVLRHLHDDPDVRISHVLLRSSQRITAELLPMLDGVHIVRRVDEITELPGFALECAGAEAVRQHVIALLLLGVDVALCSIGSLINDELAGLVREASRAGGAQAHLISGAVAGIDALSSARILGLESVTLTSRKPPIGWTGTAAEEVCDLNSIQEPIIVFRGCARRAAHLYPKNANVAATVALAGVGLDKTEITLIADPTIGTNTHQIDAHGTFGEMHLLTSNKTLVDNPRTSALAALSAIRAIRNHALAVVI